MNHCLVYNRDTGDPESPNGSLLYLITYINSSHRYSSMFTLNKLSRLDTECRYILEKRMLACKQLRDKYMLPFGNELRKLAIGHPFEYTSHCFKIIHVPEMGAWGLGIRVLDVDPPLFGDEYLSKHRVALTNLSFLAVRPEECLFMLFVTDCDIINIHIKVSDYKYLGDLSDEKRERLEKQLAYDEYYSYKTPGRYVLNLQLPMRYNPLTLGVPLADQNRVELCFTKNFDPFSGEVLPDTEFIIDVFTHAIATFNVVHQDAYNWSKYGFMFNGETNTQVKTTSLIRPLSDADANFDELTFYQY